MDRDDDQDETTDRTFDEIVELLRDHRGNLVAASVSVSPADVEGNPLVASFSGALEEVFDGMFRPELVLRIRSYAGKPAGFVHLSRTTFQRAEFVVSDPPTLTVWQRGVSITLEVYGGPPVWAPTAARSGVEENEIPF